MDPMDPIDLENPGGPVVRRARASDWTGLAGIDSIATAGDRSRRASIRRWCEHGSVLLAEDASGPMGYGVLEYTFFEQGFVTMLMVAPAARRQGMGTRLLEATEAACTTPKLFTSTNVSNLPMQQLLRRRRGCPGGSWLPSSPGWAGAAPPVRRSLRVLCGRSRSSPRP